MESGEIGGSNEFEQVGDEDDLRKWPNRQIRFFSLAK